MPTDLADLETASNALALARINLNTATVVRDNAVADWEAKAGALGQAQGAYEDCVANLDAESRATLSGS